MSKAVPISKHRSPFFLSAMLATAILLGMIISALPALAAPSNCEEACLQVQDMSHESCVSQCEEFTMGYEGGAYGGIGCWIDICMDCNPRSMGIKAFVDMVIECAEHGFSKQCIEKGLCDANDSCVHDICKCAQHDMSTQQCIDQWKEICDR